MRGLTKLLASAFVLAGAVAGCTDDGAKDPSTEEPGDGRLSVIDWATEMAQAERPDTVQDKLAILDDTDDPNAFNGVIEIAKQRAAAEAAAAEQ